LRLYEMQAQYRASAPQPNCRFNADKNAPHFCRLTWALGFSQAQAIAVLKASSKPSIHLP
jgi:hypothetical protein